MGRVVGIDYGQRRIGLSLSDETETIASPYAVVEGEEALLARLRILYDEEGLDRIVLGLPLNMDGSAGPKAQEALRFKGRLEKALGLPVETCDERLSTVQALDHLAMAGVRGRKRRARVDKVAAQIILQSYLDERRVRHEGPEPPLEA